VRRKRFVPASFSERVDMYNRLLCEFVGLTTANTFSSANQMKQLTSRNIFSAIVLNAVLLQSVFERGFSSNTSNQDGGE